VYTAINISRILGVIFHQYVLYVETRFGIGAISKPLFATNIGQHWADIKLCNVAYMNACLILVKYSCNIAPTLQRHCSYIKRDKGISLTNLGTILGWYSQHISTAYCQCNCFIMTLGLQQYLTNVMLTYVACILLKRGRWSFSAFMHDVCMSGLLTFWSLYVKSM